VDSRGGACEPLVKYATPMDWENRDATRRTRLANERTYLAWWRTGLTALAVAFGAGKLVPELAGGTQWPYEVIGIGFAVLGVAFLAYGLERHRRVEAALQRGEYAPIEPGIALALTLVGVLLGVATIVVLVVQS
jgi:inner membrane protein YidH